MNILDKLGSFGAIVAAFGMSCCLPLFATVGSVVGLGFLARYEYEMFYVMQCAVVLAVAGTVWAYLKHKNILPVMLSVLSAVLILYAVNTNPNSYLIYGGMMGLITAAVLNAIYAKRCGNCEIGGEAKCS